MSTISSTTSLLSSSVSSTTATSSASTSDIDWASLIALAVEAKTAKADTIELKITDNEAKIAAYESMQSLLADLADAAQVLSAPSGSSLSSLDVFSSRAAYLTASGSSTASSIMAATVDSGAELGTHEIAILQVAKAEKLAGTAQSSKTADMGLEGVISLGAGENLASVTITSSMSLAEIAEAINGVSATSGVTASVLAVSATDYRLVLTASETGLPLTAAATYGDDVLNQLGITDENGAFVNVLQAAQSAVFTVDGIEITRTGNDIDDVLEDVTLHIYGVTGDDETMTLEIGTDLSAVKEAIVALVDAYNAYREFAYGQQQIPTSDNADTTALFGDGTLRNINSALAEALGARIGDAGMALLGLSFDSSNFLELDEDVLDSALLNTPEAIEALLTFQMTTSDTNLMLLSRGTKDISDFTLDIVTDSSGKLVSAGIDGDDGLFTISGTRIIGKSGTIYEGYTFVYAGSTSQSVAITTKQGIAELLYNVADAASDTSGGTLSGLIENLEDFNEDLQSKADDIRSRADTYETNLTTLYARYQAAIEAAESALDYLTTLIDTWNSSS